MAPGTRRAAKEAPAICFLCGNPVEPAEMEEAYRRLRDDTVPSRTEYAHDECAEEAGLREEPEEEDELDRPPRR